MRGVDTSWTMIERAAGGDRAAREGFTSTYLPVVRAYLRARWPGALGENRLEDAVQDVFLACLKEGGAIENVQRDGGGRFRTWLYRVVLNVARRYEEKAAFARKREGGDEERLGEEPGREAALSLVFDRAWARRMVRHAVERLRAQADSEVRRRRMVILEARFGEGLPIREIAKRMDVAAAQVHHDYARARDDFKRCLRDVVSEHCSGSPAEIERECLALLARL